MFLPYYKYYYIAYYRVTIHGCLWPLGFHADFQCIINGPAVDFHGSETF